MKTKDNKIHYAWLILIACCFMCFAAGGIFYNSVGIFMPPVCEELGYTASQFSMYFNARQIVMVVFLPIAGALLPRIHPRLLLSASGICGIVSLIILSMTAALWQLYLSGAVCGIAAAFMCMTMAPIILKRWFKKKYGLAISIAMAFTGVGGMIMNPVGALMIENFGWRAAALFLAAVSALFILPFTLFVLKKEPAEIGIRAYGDEETEVLGVQGVHDNPEKKHHKKGIANMDIFLLILLNAMLIAIPQAFNSHCSQFAISVGKTAIQGAGMSSSFMLGNTIGKLGLGWLGERLSTKKTVFLGVVMVMTGFAMMLINGSYVLLLVSAFLGGISMALTSIAVPLLVADFYDSSSYDMILSYATMSSMFITGIAMSLFGWGYDVLGTYRPSQVLMVGIYAALVLALGALYRKKGR